jgi:hypothetical protein
VGEQISGILQRAHDTAEQITAQSRREAEDRLDIAREEAAQITAAAHVRLKELDADADRIWAERHRIVDDARERARQLVELADAAAERFPPAEESAERPEAPESPATEEAEVVQDPEAVESPEAVEPQDSDGQPTAVLPPVRRKQES